MKNNNTIDLIDCLTNGISEEYIGYTDKQYAKAMKKISKENKKAWAKQHREDKKINEYENKFHDLHHNLEHYTDEPHPLLAIIFTLMVIIGIFGLVYQIFNK